MRKIFFLPLSWLLILPFVLGGCGKTQPAATLFTVVCDEGAPVELQQERLYYGKLLQPVVSEGRLAMREIPTADAGKIPDAYRAYVGDYIGLVNGYLDRMPPEQADEIVNCYRACTVEEAILGVYVKYEGEQWVLDMKEAEASEIGIDAVQYATALESIRKVNKQLSEAESATISLPTEEPVSLFMNHGLFAHVLAADECEAFRADFERLNAKYK